MHIDVEPNSAPWMRSHASAQRDCPFSLPHFAFLGSALRDYPVTYINNSIKYKNTA
jgi:hypothetical protein